MMKISVETGSCVRLSLLTILMMLPSSTKVYPTGVSTTWNIWRQVTSWSLIEVLPCRVSGMTMFRSKSSATLRRTLRISSSGKSTESVSWPDSSLLLVAAGAALSFIDTSGADWAAGAAGAAVSGGGGLAGFVCASAGDAAASIADIAVRRKRWILMVIFLFVLAG